MTKHYVEPDDLFQALVVSSVTTNYYMRVTVRAHDGTVQHYDSTPESFVGDRTTSLTFTSPTNTPRVFKAGEVVNAFIATTSTTLVRGQTYARMFVFRGSMGASGTMAPYDLLGQGYVASGHTPTLDEFTEPGPAGGYGTIRRLGSADPAAAAEIASQSVPAGTIWLLRSATVQLVQGITQTPLPTLTFQDDGAVLFAQIPAMPTALGASTTAQLTWAIGVVQTSFTAVVGDEIYSAPLPVLYLPAAFAFQTVTDGIGANTNYGPMRYVVEEWVVP